jgi:hypothetical protein
MAKGNFSVTAIKHLDVSPHHMSVLLLALELGPRCTEIVLRELCEFCDGIGVNNLKPSGAYMYHLSPFCQQSEFMSFI